MTPAMVEVARQLAEVWTGPPLVQHVVSDWGPQHWCEDCGALCLGPGCIECDTVPADSPDIDSVPDLSSDANGGVLLGALGGYDARDGESGCYVNGHKAATLAHAAALAFLADR